MANRRMFSLDVVDTDLFLDLPISSQALYFHLGMRADDDGFISSPKRITSMIGAGPDDLKLLIAKGFVIALDGGIIVIRHWKQNNYIQTDRYKKTIYQEQIALLELSNGIYNISDTTRIQSVSEMETQDRIGKDSIDKVNTINYQEIINMYNDTCVSFQKVNKLSEKRKKAIKARLKIYTLEDFKKLFEMAEGSSFLKGQNNRNWSATFDWLIQDSNMAKVLDGNYIDKGKVQLSGKAKNSFNNFKQNDYDFDELEKELLSN